MDKRLVKAAREGDINTLHNLLKEDPQILEKASSVHFADSPLHVAALSGKAEFVEQIVTLKPSLATETNQQGMIPLHLASLEGHVDTVRELLKAKLEDGVKHQCLATDHEGWTPLHCASQKGQIRVIEELISKCPESLENVTAKEETVLHLAVKANQFEAVKVLADSISRHHNLRTVFKAKDQNGKTPYQLAAAKKLQAPIVEVLKEDDEISGESRIYVDEVGSDQSEASKKEESNDKESNKFREAILVVATLIITLTYQALLNPPSTFLKEGSTRIDWSCLTRLDKNIKSQALMKLLQNCPARLAFVFMLFNTMIFIQSIVIVIGTLRGPTIYHARLLTVFLVLCYSTLLTAFYYKAVYFAFPFAIAALALYWGILVRASCV